MHAQQNNSVRELALRVQRSFNALRAPSVLCSLKTAFSSADAHSALNDLCILNASSRTEFFVACHGIALCMPLVTNF